MKERVNPAPPDDFDRLTNIAYPNDPDVHPRQVSLTPEVTLTGGP